jgi:hypothetical protein
VAGIANVNVLVRLRANCGLIQVVVVSHTTLVAVTVSETVNKVESVGHLEDRARWFYERVEGRSC